MWVLYRILYIYYTVFLLNRNVGYRVLYFADVVSVVLALHKWWNLRFAFRKQPFCFEKWKKQNKLVSLCALRAVRAWHATTWPTAGQVSSWWWKTATPSTTSTSPVTALTASTWCPHAAASRPSTASRLYTGTQTTLSFPHLRTKSEKITSAQIKFSGNI